MRAKTFTWAIVPKGKRVKKILVLYKRLEHCYTSFKEKFGVFPKFVFMHFKMKEEWEPDEVLGMEIIPLKKGYPIHHYTLAVTKEDFTGVKDDGPHGIDRKSE